MRTCYEPLSPSPRQGARAGHQLQQNTAGAVGRLGWHHTDRLGANAPVSLDGGVEHGNMTLNSFRHDLTVPLPQGGAARDVGDE